MTEKIEIKKEDLEKLKNELDKDIRSSRTSKNRCFKIWVGSAVIGIAAGFYPDEDCHLRNIVIDVSQSMFLAGVVGWAISGTGEGERRGYRWHVNEWLGGEYESAIHAKPQTVVEGTVTVPPEDKSHKRV